MTPLIWPSHPPKVPTNQLRLESFRALARLQLIFEFRPWLQDTRYYLPRNRDSPLKLLWDCLLFGAPLCTLLELLGSPTPKHLTTDPDQFDFDLSVGDREKYFASFIHRVELLEAQGKLPYGEVLRLNDFLDVGCAGFARVLQVVNRLLLALQESYPGLFVAPHGSQARRTSLIQQLIDTEQAHVSKLLLVVDSASQILSLSDDVEPALEGFIINSTRICRFHGHVLNTLEKAFENLEHEHWDDIFALDDKILRVNVMGSYRSICANFISFKACLEKIKSDSEPLLSEHAENILKHLSELLHRIFEYRSMLQAILDVTSPTECPSYDALCAAVFHVQDISETIDEVGRELRTMSSSRILMDRIQGWDISYLNEFGTLLLDDLLMVDSISGLYFSVLLFDQALVYCRTSKEAPRQLPIHDYPIRAWEFGPALSDNTRLDIVDVILARNLKSLHCFDSDYFEIQWSDQSGGERSMTFYPIMPSQHEQWISALQLVIPDVYYSHSFANFHEDEGLGLSEDEDEGIGQRSVARPWSVIGRKGTHSECSSMMQKEEPDNMSLLSPNLLPKLFATKIGARQRSPSPLSLHFRSLPSIDIGEPSKPSAAQNPIIASERLSTLVPDLTGQILKNESYPSAHGGYSDIWKCTWRHESSETLVAVKVFRRTSSDPKLENKLVKNIDRELNIWRRLEHPHILPLYGTASSIGPYTSIVCPWLANGNISKYMDSHGDILSVSDRLQLLCQVAEALAYLHSLSIIHGDLTGANVLIDDDGKARLCDFGLSSITLEPCESFAPSGSIRWADPQLYQTYDEERGPPAIATWCDVYSFGSVMLEILSGRIPYHYLGDARVIIDLQQGIKPRRPAKSFIDDEQWDLIQQCWRNIPDTRPNIRKVQTSLEALYYASTLQ